MPLPLDQDPIITILQLAARRGFEIMREQIADTSPLNTNPPTEGDLCKDGENGDSRNVSARDEQNADTKP